MDIDGLCDLRCIAILITKPSDKVFENKKSVPKFSTSHCGSSRSSPRRPVESVEVHFCIRPNFVRTSSLRPFVPSSLSPFVPSSLRPFVPSSLRPFVPSSLRPFFLWFLSECLTKLCFEASTPSKCSAGPLEGLPWMAPFSCFCYAMKTFRSKARHVVSSIRFWSVGRGGTWWFPAMSYGHGGTCPYAQLGEAIEAVSWMCQSQIDHMQASGHRHPCCTRHGCWCRGKY